MKMVVPILAAIPADVRLCCAEGASEAELDSLQLCTALAKSQLVSLSLFFEVQKYYLSSNVFFHKRSQLHL